MEAAQSLPEMAHRGNLGLLEEPPTALFCANRCPGNLDIKTFDFAKTMRNAGVPVNGGFQALMEKWCLRLLLRGSQPAGLCRRQTARQDNYALRTEPG